MKLQHSFFTLLLFALGGMFLFQACGDDDETVFPTPAISVVGDNLVNLKPGQDITVELSLQAEGGLSSIIVNRGGGFLEEITLPDPDATTFTYTGQTVAADAMEGELVEYEFIGVNTQDLESAPAAFSVSVNLYDAIDIGGTSVFDVDLPADGIIPAGTTVKFAEGRSYYLAQPAPDVNISFEEGSTFQIESGVTIYLQAGVDMDVTVFGTADIRGTADAPVVMTSENVLRPGVEPEAGDWNDFQIEGQGKGTNSGFVQYLRIEYAGDRAFVLDDVGNGTQVSHVQVWQCTDEAIFIAGGDVNVSHLIATNSEDTQYRTDDDYTGNMQFIIAVSTVPGAGAESMYLRGDSEALISNVTVVGPGAEFEPDGEPDGIRFWSSRGNKMYNAVITGIPSWATRAEANETDGRPEVTDINGPVVFAYSNVFGCDQLARDDAEPFFTDPSFNNSEEAIPGLGANDFVPDARTGSDFDPSTLGSFFAPANFKGAIESPDNDWTIGWSKNPDGSVR
ncbi:MAG: hypothetical protein RIC19_22090 [Phaeodactylibacter sp.]|uniref:hypothetical protein n=1 Tax=Phaeodactylibacter sp. TaxID=1940289 RepID=UPI0032EDC015